MENLKGATLFIFSRLNLVHADKQLDDTKVLENDFSGGKQTVHFDFMLADGSERVMRGQLPNISLPLGELCSRSQSTSGRGRRMGGPDMVGCTPARTDSSTCPGDNRTAARATEP